MRLCCFYLLVLCAFNVDAQISLVTQEGAELNALSKYEMKHPPRDSMAFPAPAGNEELFGSRITRSVTLLSTSCQEHRFPVKILIYGQSIAGSKIFTDDMRDYLSKHFPYADITLENRAIGGFTGDMIVRTAVHDVYSFYPDLIIFHVYGGEEHGELEQLFSNIRRYTTSDILIFNHHIGWDEITYNEESYKYLRYLANKYNCELVDVSKEWSRYLVDNKLNHRDLLRGNIHPNRNGNWLLAQLIGRHLRYNSLFPSHWQNEVRTVFTSSAYDANGSKQLSFAGEKWKIIDHVPVGETKNASIKLSFEGNRVDIIAGKLKNKNATGAAQIYLDGKPISRTDGLYTITRPSAGPNTWWPLVRRISHNSELVPETWTLRVDKINTDSTVWFFSVKGSVSGSDGSGRSDEPFVSKSGRVVIDPSDFMFTDIKRTFETTTPVGFESHWTVQPMFMNTYQSPTIKDSSKVYKTTIVKGLKNDHHTLEIIPNGDGLVPIEAFEIYRPSLQ